MGDVLDLEVGLTDDGRVALELPAATGHAAVSIALLPDDARTLARALVAVALDGDRIRAAGN